MPSRSLMELPLGLLLFLVSRTQAALPYNPSAIFVNPKSGNRAIYYVLEPASPSYPSGRIASIPNGATLDTGSLHLETVSSALPFLEQDGTLPYTAAAQSNGTLAVLYGDCSAKPSKSSLWLFNPCKSGREGTWSRQNLSSSASSTGTQFLASGISFSYIANEPESIYTFGGMCPAANATAATWTSDATYTDQLTSIEAGISGYFDRADIGQPTPEAGFTITPLSPTYANHTDGTQIQQQQDFVLIGGHTQQAFIDMDTVALFSLPQSSWTFLPVTDPNTSADLAVRRRTSKVDSRSGHTAVLSADGSQIVVFGGWVGDVSNAADPQVAVLEVGAGYGGSNDWTWSTSISSPWPVGAGVYGHGAVMLPDNVMVVTGGYSIASSASKTKRNTAVQMTNTRNFFLNATSGKWLDSYSPGQVAAGKSINESKSGLIQTTTQKAGLGTGLAFGLIALICIVVFSVFYYRKLKRQREQHAAEVWEEREQDIDDLAHLDQAQNPAASFGGLDGRGGNLFAGYPQAGMTQRPSSGLSWTSDDGNSVRNAQRSGVHVELPSPTRGLRKSLYNRDQYFAAPQNADGLFPQRLGDMHAIQERDEENSNASSRKASSIHPRPNLIVNPAAAADLDLFRDLDPPAEPLGPNKTIHRVPTRLRSPGRDGQPAEDRQREMSGWIRDWDTAGSAAHSTAAERYSPTKSGRSSPSRSDRTRSGFSESSLHSNVSGGGVLPSRGPSSRSAMRTYLPSLLPAALSNTFTTTQSSPTRSENAHRSSYSGPSQGSDRTSSFTTAQTTITQLQAESETLLGSGSPQRSRHPHDRSPSSTAFDSNPRGGDTGDLIPDTEPTFTLPLPRARLTQQVPPNRTHRSSLVGTWVGSVKRGVGRALAGNRTVSLTTDIGRFPRAGAIGPDGYYDYSPTKTGNALKKSDLGGLVDLSTERSEAPEREATRTVNGADSAAARKEKMRRSVSEGAATFWASKRGARDWDVEPIPANVNKRNKPLKPSSSRPPTSSSASNDTGLGADLARPAGTKDGPSPHSAGVDSTLTPASARSRCSRANSTATGSEDWDVEAAAQQRVVQVMFTVPRERLRVVNADVDSGSLASTSKESVRGQ